METIHPDKGVEMFLYELSVAEAYRRRGIGRSLVEAPARERGCHGMWGGVDTDNAPALATYRGAGGRDGGGCAVVERSFVRAPPRAAPRLRPARPRGSTPASGCPCAAAGRAPSRGWPRR
ncbi:GNAT family N-acetyltransferase [Streptomyces sp. NPDC055955]|uniref:GNAT family N-acetyltransferase n=1 Tax=Streptomyces sp. NPDC055955 TaxID=3345665 RepID=UPI0035DEDF0C